MTISHLVPEDMANYTCKSRNIAGHHELNGSVTVNCETYLFAFTMVLPVQKLIGLFIECLHLLITCVIFISFDKICSV